MEGEIERGERKRPHERERERQRERKRGENLLGTIRYW
jgi:hypothetical protein